MSASLRCGAFSQLEKDLLGAIEQSGLQVVLRQLVQCRKLLLRGEIRALDQVLVHADRAVDLAAPAKQAAEREVQFDRLRIDLDHLDECLDRLVRLLVEEEIEPFEVRTRHAARVGDELLDVDARRQPAKAEEQRQREQPPELEVHSSAPDRSLAASTVEFTLVELCDDSRPRRRRRGFGRPQQSQFLAQPENLPSLAQERRQARDYPEDHPGRKTAATTNTSGACHV